MDIKTLEQALKLQSDLTTRLKQTKVLQRTGKMPAIEAILKEKEQLLALSQANLETAIKKRDAAIRRWDESVAQYKASIVKLQDEISGLKAPRGANPKRPK